SPRGPSPPPSASAGAPPAHPARLPARSPGRSPPRSPADATVRRVRSACCPSSLPGLMLPEMPTCRHDTLRNVGWRTAGRPDEPDGPEEEHAPAPAALATTTTAAGGTPPPLGNPSPLLAVVTLWHWWQVGEWGGSNL